MRHGNKALANKLVRLELLTPTGEPDIFKATLKGRALLGLGLPSDLRAKFEREAKMLLHAHRDCMRNLGEDTTVRKFCVEHRCSTYAFEFTGMMRTLRVFGFGNFGAVNDDNDDDRWPRKRLEDEVLKEENFGGSNECDYCVEHFGKDGAGRRRLR